MPSWLLIVLSYLLGGIPFGFLISRFIYHVDIRKFGSGNTGATNVWRTLGKKPGISTLTLDIIKGMVPVLIAGRLFPDERGVAISAGVAAIVGHNWSPFLKFRGGKGVATSTGAFLALLPLHATLAIIAFLIFFLTTRHVSVGSMAGAVVLLASSFIFPVSSTDRWVILLASAMTLLKHVPNMKRLAKGTEPKVAFK